MMNHLENERMVRDILRDSSIGLWCIEMDDGRPPRVYADETFREMMAMDGVMTPEEGYRFWFERIQERIIQFVTANSAIKREDFTRLMLQTGELAADVGSVIYGEEAVELGLIDKIGGLSDALDCLHGMIGEKKRDHGAPEEKK